MRKKTQEKIKDKTIAEIKQIIINLRNEINYHDKLYFEDNIQEISDLEYEEKIKELKDLEGAYFSLFTLEENLNSPTQKLYNLSSSKFNKIKHNFPMLSLNKAYSFEEIEKFINDSKEVISEIDSFYIEPKIDGLSISLHYENGVLTKALTRGNGVEGENIINNILQTKVDYFPRKIDYLNPIEIRGEIYIEKNDFFQLNQKIQNDLDLYEKISLENENLKKQNQEAKIKQLPKIERKALFLNPRNAAAGIVRKLKNISEDEMHKIKAFFYQIIEPLKHNLNLVSKVIDFLKNNKFPINDKGKEVKNLKEIKKIINDIDKNRDLLAYEIDGIVLKVNNLLFYDELGSTSKFPKGAIAYKFYDEIVKTELKAIDYQIGRTGKIAYVALLKPVMLNGTKVEKAYLHNYVNILNLKIRINEEVYIKKSGEIIPQVLSSVKKFDSTNVQILTNCPSCNSVLNNTEKEQFCLNENCDQKNIRKIIHFFSKQALNVQTLSKKTIEQFYNFKIIKDPIDVFLLEQNIDKIFEKNGEWKKKFQMRSIINLLKAINDSKTIEFSRFIYALGIKNVGADISLEISKKINSIDELLNYNYDNFINTNKFGQTIIDELKSYFSNQKNIEFLNKLKELNFNFKKNVNKIISSKIENLSFVITGTLTKTRNEFKKIIIENSGILSNSITSKTNYLILGDDPGESKILAAKKHNIKTITEKDFYKMIK